MSWVLKDGNKYLQQMTGIGPMSTEFVNRAEVFESREDAVNSPAMRHSMSFFMPFELLTENSADDPGGTAAGNDLPKYDPKADIKATLRRNTLPPEKSETKAKDGEG